VFSCTKKPANKIRIATAANAQYAISEIAVSFTKETGTATEVIQGSSGKIVAQIKAGAPFDIFISADMKYPDELYKLGLTKQKPAIYAFGKLVLWTSKDIFPNLGQLTKENIVHVAIPNPKTAPYGKAANEFLKQSNLLDSIKHKLVFGESVAQTTQFIASGSADIGFTAMSVVLNPQLKHKGHWLVMDSIAYSPIAQGAVVIKKQNQNTKQAEQFYAYLFSDKAKIILEKYGYSN